MRRVSGKTGLVIGSILAFSLLFNSIVYACSGLMGMTVPGVPMHSVNMDGMNDNAVERGPCADHKQDICKNVRDRTLSIQPAPLKPVSSQQSVMLILPLNLIVDISKHIASALASLEWETAFHAVFKLPLRISYRVLRI
jgi:hypothetical protein